MGSGEGFRLPVRKPISAWWSGIRFDLRSLFVSLGAAAINAKVHKWPEAAIKLVEGISSSSANGEPAELAWTLITRSMVRTISGIVPLNEGGVLQLSETQIADVCSRLDLRFQDEILEINQGFFEYPSDLPLLASLAPPLSVWLQELFLDNRTTEDLLLRLRSDFPENLIIEWQAGKGKYQPILNAFQSPFTDALLREGRWVQYVETLGKELQTSRLDKRAPLSRCFVPLRAYFSADDTARRRETRQVVDVPAHLAHWLNSEEPESCLLIISGHLGAGKTSTAKTFAFSTNREAVYKALFVSIDTLSPNKGLREAVEGAANNYGLEDIFNMTGERKLLLILDGLEDYKELTDTFLNQAQHLSDDLNKYRIRVKVLITTKPALIPALPKKFRAGGNLLTLLPHFVPESEHSEFVDPHSLLKDDRRQKWCDLYAQVTGADLKTFRSILAANEQLSELSAQPLVLHLLAMTKTLTSPSGPVQIELASVYRQLLENVYEQNWKTSWFGQRTFSFEAFSIFFEQLAWRMWQSRRKTISIIDIRGTNAALSTSLKGFSIDNDIELVRLLSSFFVVEVHDVGDPQQRYFTFEHGGFAQYLVSCGIVRQLRRLVAPAERERKGLAKDEPQELLDSWIDIIGTNALSLDHLDFFKSELRLRSDTEVLAWLNFASSLFRLSLDSGITLGAAGRGLQFWDAVDSVRNADEALLAIQYCCAAVLKQSVEVNCSQPDRFGHWLSLMVGQRRSRENRLFMSCLERFDFRKAGDLLAKDFVRAKLRGSIFSGINMRWTNFREADLSQAYLNESADLRDCDFEDADLSGADLSSSLLKGANLRWANLEGAILTNCDLEGADLYGASMKGAKCDGASFRRAVLVDLDCSRDEIIGLDIEGAVLSFNS